MYVVLVVGYLRHYSKVNLLDGGKDAASVARFLTRQQDTFFAVLMDKDKVNHTAVRSTTNELERLRALCEKKHIDCELYNDIGTFNAARDRIADVLALMPDEHVVLVSVG